MSDPDPASSKRPGVIGLGLAALGRPAYINLGHADDLAGRRDVDSLRAHCHHMLDAAWEQGIRHFDVARSYGLAEEFLGDWLRSHPGRREQLTISSKWGYTYVGDWRTDVATHEVKDHSLATFERQWPQTLAALGGPPDFYLVHSVTPDSPVLEDIALLAALAELTSGGVRIGFSTSGPAQADVLKAALQRSESLRFTAVQSTWNLLEPSTGVALANAATSGWHVALKETVANGRLTWRGDADVRDLAERLRTSPDALAIRAALDTSASVVLIGPSTEGQLTSNLGGRDLRIDDVALEAVGKLRTDPADYWSARSDLPWT